MFDFELDTSIGEYRIPGETDLLRDYVGVFNRHFAKHYLNKGVTARRAIHAKSHGFLKASFEVFDHQDSDLKYGIFREPAVFQAVVRLSNGDGPPVQTLPGFQVLDSRSKSLGSLPRSCFQSSRRTLKIFSFSISQLTSPQT